MSSRIAVVALVAACIGGAGLRAQTPAPVSLLVLSKSDQMLVIVDPTTLTVVGRAPSGPDPHEVVASSDGRVAYISNYNGGTDIISVVDLVAVKPLPPINLGPLGAPHGLAFVAGKLWFTAEGAKVIGRYDPASRAVDWVLGTGQNRTHMIVVSANLQHIVTSNVSSATMTFIEKAAGGRGGSGRGGPRDGGPGRGGRGPGGPPDGNQGPPLGIGAPPPRGIGPGGPGGGQGDWDETIVPVGRGAEGFDVSPDGKEVWAANAQDGTVSIVNVATKTVTQTLAANVSGANRLKFTPDGRLVLVSTLGGSDLTIIDVATRREVKRVNIGHGAAGIQIQPDGLRAFIACTPDDYVAILDLKSLEVVGQIKAGGQPDGLAWVVRR